MNIDRTPFSLWRKRYVLFVGLTLLALIGSGRCWAQDYKTMLANLLDEEGNPVDVNTLANQPHNTIVMVMTPPHCHDCEEDLYHCFNRLKLKQTKIYVIFGCYNSALQRREMMSTAKELMQQTFVPLFYDVAWYRDHGFHEKTPFLLMNHAYSSGWEKVLYETLFIKADGEFTNDKELRRVVNSALKKSKH